MWRTCYNGLDCYRRLANARCRAVFYLSKRSPWRNNEGRTKWAAEKRVQSKDKFHRERKLRASLTRTWAWRKVRRRKYGRILWGTGWNSTIWHADMKRRARITLRPLKDWCLAGEARGPSSLCATNWFWNGVTHTTSSRYKRDETMFLENSIVRCIDGKDITVVPRGYERNIGCQQSCSVRHKIEIYIYQTDMLHKITHYSFIYTLIYFIVYLYI